MANHRDPVKPSIALRWVLALLLLASIACQTGEILTPEEATARAQQAQGGEAGSAPSTARGAEFQVNETVEFTGTEFLIPLRKEPGDVSPFSFAGRGDQATVLGSREVEGEVWYLVKSAAGEGWVPAKFLKSTGPSAAEGPQPGETVYLTGKGFLINLMDGPGGKRIIANQERGAAVTILEVVELEGKLWYRIDAPTGQGWVPADNISTEAP